MGEKPQTLNISDTFFFYVCCDFDRMITSPDSEGKCKQNPPLSSDDTWTGVSVWLLSSPAGGDRFVFLTVTKLLFFLSRKTETCGGIC